MQKIEGERIQGLLFDIVASSGKIHIKDIYTDKSSFTIDSGHIHLGNCHRDANIKISQGGQLTVGECSLLIFVMVNQNFEDEHCMQCISIFVQSTFWNISDSVDGNLTADVKHGNIDIYAVKHDTIDVHTGKGNWNLFLLYFSTDRESDRLIKLLQRVSVKGMLFSPKYLINTIFEY